MRKRRAFGDAVQKRDGDGKPYLVRFIPTKDGADADYCVAECGDPECSKGLVAEILDDQAQPTGANLSRC